MSQRPDVCHRLAGRLGLFLIIVFPMSAWSQTVGDTFIDTSEWVQSSSPIRDQGRVNGYITETIVRGYRGPNYDRYYGGGNYNSAIEFTDNSRIQPIVYENAAPPSTSLEPSIRPTPDPVVQAANNGNLPSNSNWNQGTVGQVRPATLNDMRGYASHANYQRPVNRTPPSGISSSGNYFSQPTNNSYSPPGRLIHTSYVAPPVGANQPTSYTNMPNYPRQQNYPVNYQPNYQQNYPTGYQTAGYNPPPVYASAQTNCCDPVYTQTQFVTPNVNTGPGALRTYPQYGGNPYANPNPYPNRGYGISQPYTRDTWVPMFQLRSMPYGVYLGQGWVGQPVAYVEGEPVRNFMRYIFP